jgi:hypothetical protein
MPADASRGEEYPTMEEREHYDIEVSSTSGLDEAKQNPYEDKLLWRDKGPLAVALVAQSYVVFLWYVHSTRGIDPYVDFIIALAAGIALDWLTISTVMGRREGRSSIWSWLTSLSAFFGSAMIAYDTYATQWLPIDGKALLHICFPLMVLLYSLHLASPRRPRRVKAISHLSTHQQPLLGVSDEPERAPGTREELAGVPITTSAPYTCPSCGAGLERIGELGAAKRWGHCQYCKGNTSTTIPLTYPGEHSQNGTGAE